MSDALYGVDGFYRRAGGPAAHFATSAHSPVFAEAVLALARRCGLAAVVDVGAGGGELLGALHRLAPSLALHGVDLAGRPGGLPAAVGWSTAPPPLRGALVLANEWLDNVPVDVVQSTADGPRAVLVDDRGGESLGGVVGGADRGWLDDWWPLASVGDRAEVGRTRDEAWAALVGATRRCVLVAVDYAHSAGARPQGGSLAGHRAGRRVRLVPDGSCDITAHVALDACAAAGAAAGAVGSRLLTQREALLGLDIAARPAEVGAGVLGRLPALERSGEVAELVDRDGLGAFTWLVQSVGRPLPELA